MNQPIRRLARSAALRAAVLTALAAGLPAPALAQQATAQLEEVTVTARKREESLQETPVAVSALSDLQLEAQQIRGLQDLDLGLPNVAIVRNTSTTNAAQIYVRGIGQDESTFHAEQGVGVYLDGVILGKANGALLDLIDFERIEVLRGPQGTLYGRNNTAGAIKFVSRRPDLAETRFVADATVGSYGQADLRASVSTPLVEGRTAFKFDFVSRKDDGFVSDFTRGERINDLDRQTARAALRWQPSEATEVYATVDYTRDASGIQQPIPIQTVAGVTTPLYGLYNAGRSIPNLADFTGYGASVEVKRDLGFASLVSLTGFRTFDSDLAGDLDGTPVPAVDFLQFLEQRQLTQEFQLTSAGSGPLSYVLGVYAFVEKTEQEADNVFQGTLNRNEQDADSYAAYGELSYALTSSLSGSLGLRYTRDEKTMAASGRNRTSGALLFDTERDVSFSDVSPRAVLDWQVAEDVLLYASWSKGYKSGGFANGRPANASQATGVFPAEEVKAWEIGAKTEFLDRRLRVNAAAFFNDYTDLGLSFLQAGQLSITSADVEIKGLELEATAVLADGLTAYLNAAYLDGEYTRVPGINPATGTPIAGLTLQRELKHVPETHWKLGLSYVRRTAGGPTWGVDANYARTDEIWRNLANSPAILSPAVGFLDARVYVETADERWRLTLAGRNLTDEVYWYQGVNPFSRYYSAPATWSATFTFRL